VDDPGHLGRFQIAPRIKLEQYGGSGFLLFPDEDGRLGNGQMHPGGLDRGNGLDGFCQLPFQGPLVIDLLGKLADTELLVFHQFEAHGAAFGQALAG